VNCGTTGLGGDGSRSDGVTDSSADAAAEENNTMTLNQSWTETGSIHGLDWIGLGGMTVALLFN